MYSYVHAYCEYIHILLHIHAQYYTRTVSYTNVLYMNAEVIDRECMHTHIHMYKCISMHVCRLGNLISLHMGIHTQCYVWFSQVTHISHWRTEVHSTIRIQ